MAEILVNIFNNTTFDPDDVIQAFNDRRILQTHAEHVCHVDHFGFNSDGLRSPHCLTHKMAERIFKYGFYRVSKTEVERVTLATGESEILSDQPNGKGEAIHAEEFIKRRKKHPRHMVFGEAGAEFWFGGRKDLRRSVVDSVWDDIEANSDKRRADHGYWPLTENEKYRFLGLGLVDFDDTERSIMEADLPQGEDLSKFKKRLTKVLWQDLPDLSSKTKADVADPGKRVDIRGEFQFVWRDIIQLKGLKA